jgi:hypothetical protein
LNIPLEAQNRALAAQAVREFAAFEPEPAQKLTNYTRFILKGSGRKISQTADLTHTYCQMNTLPIWREVLNHF